MVNSTTTANELIQEQVASILVQPLEAASVVLSSGPRIFDSSEPLRIPRLVSGFTPAFVAENAEIPESDADFGELTLMPSDRKGIKALTRFSNELLRQSHVSLDSVMKARLVTDVGAGRAALRPLQGLLAITDLLVIMWATFGAQVVRFGVEGRTDVAASTDDFSISYTWTASRWWRCGGWPCASTAPTTCTSSGTGPPSTAS